MYWYSFKYACNLLICIEYLICDLNNAILHVRGFFKLIKIDLFYFSFKCVLYYVREMDVLYTKLNELCDKLVYLNQFEQYQVSFLF